MKFLRTGYPLCFDNYMNTYILIKCRVLNVWVYIIVILTYDLIKFIHIITYKIIKIKNKRKFYDI